MRSAVAFALLALVLVASAQASVEDEHAVTKTLNRYMQKLNGLVEFAQGPDCAGPGNVAGHAAWAADLVNTFFSQQIQGFVVTQTTNGVPATGPFLNISVGSPANPQLGLPAIDNSSQLHDLLIDFYVSFTGYGMSSPFHWLLSVPVVTIQENDPAYSGQTTAYVLANNENKGYGCSSGVRTFTLQFSLYRHVLVKEGSDWKFIHFAEDNKNKLQLNDITQLEPQFA